ncbi:la-related protein 1C-like [Benincasa hispida]|uniref:la-related protein 1C-like n=1 Tax=Benincasa hispida TaxID=102211 RepID=UPI0018FFC688|nr:la-related protein 1C-like [Benincasa hispida]
MAATNLSDNNPAMATAPAHHSRHSGQNVSSPKSRRSTRPVSSPWTQIVRGELEIPAVVPSSPANMTSSAAIVEPRSSFPSSSPSSSLAVEEPAGAERSESGNESLSNAGNKPAWNKLSNGAVEVGPVMGAVSWPALSESTRFSTKSSLESPKDSVDGSIGPACEGIGNPPSLPYKECNSASPISNPNPNPAPTPTLTPTLTPTHRQKSMKRSGASNSHSGGVSQQSTTPGSIIDTTPSNPSSKEHIQRSSFASQSQNDHSYQHQRNSFSRRGSGYPRGDSSHHHNHGSRRDHDRGNHDWNPHRNYGQPQRVVQRYIRPPPPPSNATFVPSSMRPLGGPIPFHEFVPPVVYVAAPPQEALRSVPFVAPIPPNAVFFPASDPQLYARIVHQIEYYFSDGNLVKDTFLRGKMDEDGWVPIHLVASFKMVRSLTDNIPVILDALRMISTSLEVQGDKVRRRNDYSKWIMLPSTQTSNDVAPLSPANSSQDLLAAGVQSITLETYSGTESWGDFHVEALQSQSPRNFNSQSQPLGTGKPNIGTGLDHSFSARN